MGRNGCESNYDRNPREQTERFKKFTKQDIEDRDFNLDIFWLRNRSSVDSNNLPDPVELADEAIIHLQSALHSLNELILRSK
jgi:type I restriction enzyme M protein